MYFTLDEETLTKMAESVAEGARNQRANVKLMRIADDVPIENCKKKMMYGTKNILNWKKRTPLQNPLQLLKKWENLML